MVEKIDIKEMINARRARGMLYLERGLEPKEMNQSTWIVPSQTGNGTYTVHFLHHSNNCWSFTCPDFQLSRTVERLNERRSFAVVEGLSYF